ncbi:hypothetical protein AB4114_29890 [Paenibacillus sp. 2RAB27]|uniref:hypothetical protein n=1 Tax=Paenibacillus sp. 2RAB27 TaxID=3232991 RepID=UPI003F9E4217
MSQLARFKRSIKTIYKLIISKLKSNWSLRDYPIEYRQQEMLDLTDTNLTMYPWEARIINWNTMNGDGYTKKEAFLKLREKFEKYKSEGRELPRPGLKMKLTFASAEKIGSFDTAAVQFFKVIFEIDYNGIFISDESSMYDFCWTDDSLNEKQLKIAEAYGIDIKDIEGLKIVDILRRIKEAQASKRSVHNL